MQNRRKLIFIAALLPVALLLAGAMGSSLFKINKNFEIFGEIYRSLLDNYVDELDPDQLSESAIEGMLGDLDPYSYYIKEEDHEEIDIITEGNYIGLGITVGTRDSMLTIMEVQEGYPAQKAGIRVGDRIYQIDTAIVLRHPSDDLRQYTKGRKGEEVTVRMLRDGLQDTLEFTLARQEISLANIGYTRMLDHSTGYIRLDRFSRGTAADTRKAIKSLQLSNHDMSSLIIDLRGNPGGILSAAVDIAEMFVPRGSLIVSTKGRRGSRGHSRDYKSYTDPDFPDLKLAVLIDGSSASASEVLAGALQDIDRAVIVGQRSFGKGLVQSVFSLPYNNTLKMTTAKYYTPSGRCIQSFEYNKSKHSNEKPDTNIFYTQAGRPVYESEGILPDTVVKNREFPELVMQIFQQDLIFRFANIYSSSRDTLPKGFVADKKVLDEFYSFLNSSGFYEESFLAELAGAMSEQASKEKMPDKILNQLESVGSKVKSQQKKMINNYHEDISELLSYEIKLRFYPYEDVMKARLPQDEEVRAAMHMLKPAVYTEALAGRPGTGSKN